MNILIFSKISKEVRVIDGGPYESEGGQKDFQHLIIGEGLKITSTRLFTEKRMSRAS